VEGGVREPLAFGILFGAMGLMLELFWQYLTGDESLSSMQIEFLAEYGTSLGFLATAALCPFAATFMICMTSLLVHLLLSVVRGGKNGFEATFRAVCYSQAAQFWAIIPYVGGVVATLWLLGVLLVGMREIHGVSYTKVVIAFLIPVVVVVAALMAAGVSLFLMD
ncbi:MAG TPA: YIP1 family protein, partial [Desulfatiglandales bacterium]|nr:YIP1 family protein [Desulfatiglandales bacterium]